MSASTFVEKQASHHTVMADSFTYDPYLWVSVYELALDEKSPEFRQRLLLEAQMAVLQRARGLEETHGSDLECAALEAAAAVIGDMKCKEVVQPRGRAFA